MSFNTERIFVAVDLETTGLDAQKDAIIEIGAVRIQGDRVIDRFSTLINPGRKIPLRIEQITGITDKDVANAPTLAEIAPEFLAFVDAGVTGVIAHNAGFDLGFLEAANIRFHRPALDTFELSTILLPGMPSYSLGELCRGLGIVLEDAHRALDDAEASARLFMMLNGQIQCMDGRILAQLMAAGAQVDWPPMLLIQDEIRHRQAEFGDDWVAQTQPDTPAPDRRMAAGVALDQGGGSGVQVDPSQLTHILEPGGILAQRLGDQYEHRVGQSELAGYVLNALNVGDHLLAEAGTGTGKSLAYLLPAALWSVANEQRVVVATNTITLQDQLLDSEIPRVRDLLGDLGLSGQNWRTALLKGRSNYLCTRRLHLWQQNHQLSALEMRVLAKVLVWLSITQTGDMSELLLYGSQEQAIWAHMASDPATCSRERCFGHARSRVDGSREDFVDFFLLAKQEAEAAHLVVVNHALLMADISAGGRVLPAYDHLIIDEAHRLEETATDQMTYRADAQSMERLLARLDFRGELADLLRRHPPSAEAAAALAGKAKRILPRLQEFTGALARFTLRQPDMRKESKYTQRLLLDGAVRSQPRWSQIEVEWQAVSTDLGRLADGLKNLGDRLRQAGWDSMEPQATHLGDLLGLSDAFADLLGNMDEIIYQPSGHRGDVNGQRVCWLELDTDGERVSLCSAPVYVGELVNTNLVNKLRATILTGATLRTGDGFGYVQERLGLWDINCITIPSPFDYKRNVLLCLPTDMPLPNHPAYQQAVEQAIVRAAQATDGHTLALFTSYAHLRATANAIRGPLDRSGIVVLEHGGSSRRRLLREFKEAPKAVLLGTRSFWEGVDLPGDELECLLIVKLPFSVPSDPLVAARSQHFDDPFSEYTLPETILRFRQGFGRLVRRASDRGSVILLDSRIWRKGYGQGFLDALPDCTVRRVPVMNLDGEIKQWLADIR